MVSKRASKAMQMQYTERAESTIRGDMGEDSELTDRAMQSEIELLADLMTAATAVVP